MKKSIFNFVLLISAVTSVNYLFAQKKIITIDTMCFNSEGSDYGYRQFNGKSYVVSTALPDESGKIPIDEVSLRPFSDVYEITDCKLNELKLLSKEFNVLTSVNSTLNDGPISISGDGKLFFFTNNSFSKTGKLGIFYCISESGKWSSPLAFPLNDDTYNVTHPYYDSENKRLYFASNYLTGGGNYDIFYSEYNGSDWSRPIAVSVNSDFVEMMPMVCEGKLYYTSNKSGLGGFDLFSLEEGKDVNLGEPFNSKFDDLSLFAVNDSMGYFSSNRANSWKHDDVYSYTIVTEKPVIAVVKEIIPEPVNDIDTIVPIQIDNVNFSFDSYVISAEQKLKIDKALELILADKELRLVVTGHTDNTGPSSYNQILSKQRAEAVKNYLVLKGVTAERITVEYKGYTEPIDSNATPEGRAKNRRVQFKVIPKIKL
jgi:outer membrane protein OmpA-like peptidoglycan-associated protein